MNDYARYTFPTFEKSLFEYRDELKKAQKRSTISFLIFALLPFLWLSCLPIIAEYDNESLSFSCTFTIMLLIVFVWALCYYWKLKRKKLDLIGKIRMTLQYLEFINQGYESKDAYRFTLEWWDRQKQLATHKSTAKSASIIALFSMIDFFSND